MRNLCSDKIEEVSWGEDAEAMNAEGTAVMRESGGPAGARRGDCGFREGTAAGARRGGGVHATGEAAAAGVAEGRFRCAADSLKRRFVCPC